MKRFIVGITGASGSIYAIRVIEELLERSCEVFLVVSQQGRLVIEYEMKEKFDEIMSRLRNKSKGQLYIMDNQNMFEPIASGSFHTEGMIIVPASMGTLSKIRHGISDSLLTRAADVCIKEKRKLVVVPRETPLSSIHLDNMHYLSKLDVYIVPPMPAFYQLPNSLEEMINHSVGRLLNILGIQSDLYVPWGYIE